MLVACVKKNQVTAPCYTCKASEADMSNPWLLVDDDPAPRRRSAREVYLCYDDIKAFLAMEEGDEDYAAAKARHDAAKKKLKQ